MAYEKHFFEFREKGAYSSANTIVPFLIKLIKPTSVIDIGCGTGTWLEVFSNNNIEDIVGVDGPWVPVDMVNIPKSNFFTHDLNTSFDLQKEFDLVVSLEVAEHLEQKSANIFIENLVAHGKVIYFSAAVPKQGGEGHLNEQWPSYWIEKFKLHGYHSFDLRAKFWGDQEVKPWYSQNSFFFIHESKHDLIKKIEIESQKISLNSLNIIHPDLYLFYRHRETKLKQIDYNSLSIKKIFKHLPKMIYNRLIQKIPN